MNSYEILSLILTVLVFPFAGYFFKKNERLHEETQRAQAAQDIVLATHAERIERNREDVANVTERVVKLEEWYPQPFRQPRLFPPQES